MMRSAPAAARQRLGDLLIRRRIELEPRYRLRTLFAEEHSLNWRLLYDIEKARRDTFTDETIAAVEVAYRWREGSVQRVLDGGDPDPVPPADEAVPRGDLFEDPAFQAIWETPGLSEAEKLDAITAIRARREKVAAAGFTPRQQQVLRNAPDAYKVLMDRQRQAEKDEADGESALGDRPA